MVNLSAPKDAAPWPQQNTPILPTKPAASRQIGKTLGLLEKRRWNDDARSDVERLPERLLHR